MLSALPPLATHERTFQIGSSVPIADVGARLLRAIKPGEVPAETLLVFLDGLDKLS